MIEQPKVLAVVIAAALAGVLGLYAYSVSVEPDSLAISELGPRDVGRYVRLSGTVSSPRLLSTGAVKLALVDIEGGASVTVFVDAGALDELEDNGSLVPGALVRATGMVEEYEGEVELHVASGGSFVLLAAAGEMTVPIADLLASPELFDGMELRASGRFQSPGSQGGGTGFALVDTAGGWTSSLSCQVEGWDWRDGFPSVAEGDRVELVGSLAYRSSTGQWVMFARGPGSIEIVPPGESLG